MRCVGSLPLVLSVSAFLISSGAFAQMSVSAVNGRPDPWNDGDRERKHRSIESDVDRVYEDRQSPAAAVVTLHRLAHRVPRRAQQEFKRARIAQLKGDHQAAIVLFQKAIAIDPDFCEALNDLGKSYLEIDQLDLAIEQFKRASVVDSHAAGPQSNLAVALLRDNQYAEAGRETCPRSEPRCGTWPPGARNLFSATEEIHHRNEAKP